MDKVCPVCFNAYVYNSLPKVEEDYFDEGLNDTNDFGSRTVGTSNNGFQMYINSGGGRPLEIETCQWTNDKWHTMAVYRPKFCPECGRALTEYNKE